jgi:hypothetical protein
VDVCVISQSEQKRSLDMMISSMLLVSAHNQDWLMNYRNTRHWRYPWRDPHRHLSPIFHLCARRRRERRRCNRRKYPSSRLSARSCYFHCPVLFCRHLYHSNIVEFDSWNLVQGIHFSLPTKLYFIKGTDQHKEEGFDLVEMGETVLTIKHVESAISLVHEDIVDSNE